MDDPVHKPVHYTTGTIEVIDFIVDQKLGYRLGNAVKYICRCRHKGNMLQDLQKARQYIEFVIDELEGGNEFSIEPYTQEVKVSKPVADDLLAQYRGFSTSRERSVRSDVRERGEEKSDNGGEGVDTPCWERCAAARRIGSKIAKSTGGY